MSSSGSAPSIVVDLCGRYGCLRFYVSRQIQLSSLFCGAEMWAHRLNKGRPVEAARFFAEARGRLGNRVSILTRFAFLWSRAAGFYGLRRLRATSVGKERVRIVGLCRSLQNEQRSRRLVVTKCERPPQSYRLGVLCGWFRSRVLK